MKGRGDDPEATKVNPTSQGLMQSVLPPIVWRISVTHRGSSREELILSKSAKK
jgi:hypothetical protein